MDTTGHSDFSQGNLLAPQYSPSLPFNDLPLLPPGDSVETLRTLKKAIGANKAVAELKGVGGLIPSQEVLLRAILLQEAKLSSEIENIVTTNDKLYRAMAVSQDTADPNTKEVLRYGKALNHGHTRLCAGQPLSATLFIDLAQIIKNHALGIRSLPGTKIVNEQSKAVIYTPPEGDQLIRQLLDNLSEYLYQNDGVDPLIKMAVAHYQFEAIHPFSDGNGRTGRVINILYLLDRHLIEKPVLYLSQYILEHKVEYYQGLRNVTENGDWETWILYMLEAIEQTATDTRDRVIRIRQSLDESIDLARSTQKRGYSKELIELIFQQPYTRIQNIVEAGLAKRASASQYLKELESLGLIEGIKFGREMLYINRTLMQILSS